MQIQTAWFLTPARAAIHLPTATAVVSDLHLGYGEARRRGGDSVPTPDLFTLLEPLRQAFRTHAVRRLVIAGDLFEAGHSVEIVTQFKQWLESVAVALIAVVPGNHDRGLARAADLLPLFPDGYSLGKWHVVHGDAALPETALVQGHEHPWFRYSPTLSAPCYLISANRIILPAFSTDAAGVNVLGRPQWRDFRCAVVVGDAVLDFGRVGEVQARLRNGTGRTKK